MGEKYLKCGKIQLFMAYYDAISKSYDELHREEQLKKIVIIRDSMKIGKEAKLLDVGCGTGISSGFGCSVVGIDPSIELLKLNKNNKKIAGTAEALPFRDGVFDYVISVTAVHNFKNIKKSIKEMKRVGRRNFVFSVLKKSRRFNFIKNVIGKNFTINKTIEEEKDVIFFCRAKLCYPETISLR